MICNHCGKEIESITTVIAELHSQGMTPPQIRDEVVSRGYFRNSMSKPIKIVHAMLRQIGLTNRKSIKI